MTKLEEYRQMQEDRKLILQFMDWKPILLQGYKKLPQYDRIVYKIPNSGWEKTIELLDFQTSWDLLMLVVEKIEQISKRTKVAIFKKSCGIYCKGDAPHSYWRVFNDSTKIESTYKNCVNFIKWYNEEKNEKKL